MQFSRLETAHIQFIESNKTELFLLTCGLTLDITPARLEAISWPLESCWRPDLDRALNRLLLKLGARVRLSLVVRSRVHGRHGAALGRAGLSGSSEEVSNSVKE